MKFLIILVMVAVFISADEVFLFKLSYMIKFYHSGGSTDYNLTNIVSLVDNPNFNPNQKTVLYLHGFLQTISNERVRLIRKAYVKANYNFLLFDLNPIYYNHYRFEEISKQLAKTLLVLFDIGLDKSKFELLGYSIGAQLAGYVARNVIATSNGTVTLPRVIGLEPVIKSPESLSEADADFVMTVHTGNTFSNETNLGHVAFFPNGGQEQPMCKISLLFISFDNPICSHGQAQEFWIEAVSSKSATIFPAVPCKDEKDFFSKKCNSETSIGYMNPQASNLLRGKYYLTTNEASPYAKSTAGA